MCAIGTHTVADVAIASSIFARNIAKSEIGMPVVAMGYLTLADGLVGQRFFGMGKKIAKVPAAIALCGFTSGEIDIIPPRAGIAEIGLSQERYFSSAAVRVRLVTTSA